MSRTSVLAVVIVLTSFACSGSPSGPSGPSGPAGTLNLRITDSPYGSAKAVLVTFSEVALQRSGGDWTTVPFSEPSASTWTCDLKKLQNSAQDVLGTGRLATGQYTMVRLVVQSARIFFDASAVSPTPCARSIPAPAGASFPLTMASGTATVNGTFTMTENGATTILVDFDGEASISQSGSTYAMTPVVRLVSVQ
jgi:hypothetical protein